MTNDLSVSRAIALVAEQSIDKASLSFSKMLKSGAAIELKRITMTDITEITEQINQDNQEVVGALVDLVGDAPFKFLFYVEPKGAFMLTDLLLRREVGLTHDFNEYVSSTIQEIGNILASAVANTFAAQFQISMKPSPPQVICDFAGTIFQEFIMEAAMESNRILLLESQFQVVKVQLKCRMFILPNPGSEKILEFAAGA